MHKIDKLVEDAVKGIDSAQNHNFFDLDRSVFFPWGASRVDSFKTRKNITLIIRGLIGRSGGAERIYCELANILHQSGFNVTCLFYDNKVGETFYPIDNEIERINLYPRLKKRINLFRGYEYFVQNNIRDKIIWNRENLFFVEQLQLFFQYRRPDVAISLLPPANTPTLMAARDTGVKVIPCNHNVPAQDYENPARWSANPMDRKRRLESLDYADAIHVLFPQFADWFPKHLQDRIVSIPNYISPDFRRPETKASRDKIILGVGRLAEVKNYLQLIRSWSTIAAQHPDWKVRLFGVGPQLAELKSEIRNLGIAESVELAGHRNDLADEYRKASIFCHPALFEGFGLSAAEALFMETPVICYADCSGINQFVKDGFNGLAIDRNDPEDALAKALNKLILDQGLRERLGSNGPTSVAHFSIDSYRDNWVQLITRLTGERS